MNEHEPIHVHVKKGGSSARIVLVPEIDIDKNFGFKANELREIIRIIAEHFGELIKSWNDTFGK